MAYEDMWTSAASGMIPEYWLQGMLDTPGVRGMGISSLDQLNEYVYGPGQSVTGVDPVTGLDNMQYWKTASGTGDAVRTLPQYQPQDDFMMQALPLAWGGALGLGMAGMLPGTTALGSVAGDAAGYGMSEFGWDAPAIASQTVYGGAASAIDPITGQPWPGGASSAAPGLGGGGALSGPAAAVGAGGGAGAGGFSDVLSKFMSGGGGGSILSNPASILSLLSGVYGLSQTGKLIDAAKSGAASMDPFGPYRAGYAQQLAALMADPSQVTKIPGYQAGLDAVNRGMAASGYLGSGNQMAGLQQYGGQFYQQQLDNLMKLSGANIAPGGGNLPLAGQQAATNLASSSLGSIGYGAMLPQLQALLAGKV